MVVDDDNDFGSDAGRLSTPRSATSLPGNSRQLVNFIS